MRRLQAVACSDEHRQQIETRIAVAACSSKYGSLASVWNTPSAVSRFTARNTLSSLIGTCQPAILRRRRRG